MPYLGTESLAGLTARQVAAVEAALTAAPSIAHDGLWRAIALNLGDLPCPDAVLQAALNAALFDNGVPSAIMRPYTSATSAGLNGTITVGANVTSRQLLNKSFGASGSFGADAMKV